MSKTKKLTALTEHQTGLIRDWEAAVEKANIAKERLNEERFLRGRLAALMFDSPVEGTNHVVLPSGWKLTYTHSLDRKIDAEALDSLRVEMLEKIPTLDQVVVYKPVLNTAQYRQLNEEQRALIEQFITTKPAAPAVKLVPPKK